MNACLFFFPLLGARSLWSMRSCLTLPSFYMDKKNTNGTLEKKTTVILSWLKCHSTQRESRVTENDLVFKKIKS